MNEMLRSIDVDYSSIHLYWINLISLLGAVDAARDLNTSELNRLQKQSVDDEAEITSLDLKLKELNKDNEMQS